MMEIDEYIRRFDLAPSSCLEFARTCAIENLPGAIRFDVALNRERTSQLGAGHALLASG